MFRKAAIDKVSSPEQLDLMMEVTSPVGWLGLVTVGVLLAVALVWGVLGTIPDLVDGRGVLLRGERLHDVDASMVGTIQKIHVSPGDDIEAGQLVATITRAGGGREERRAAEATIGRNEAMIASKKNELASIQRQRKTQKELVDRGLKAANVLFEFERRANAVRGEINALERENAGLLSKLESTAEVRSAASGRVVEVLKAFGDSVQAGEALVRVELSRGEDQEFCDGQIHALLYVPGALANKVLPGHPARVSPLDVKREEYGFIMGHVEWVSRFAASPEDMREKLKNDALVRTYAEKGPVFEARVCLEEDPDNEANGFRWSSSRGPDRAISTGGQCTASVVVAEKRPYTYVIPAVRRSAGL